MVGETVRTPCPVPLVYAEAEAALVDLLELTERLKDAATYVHVDEPAEIQLGAVTGKQAKALRKVIAALEAGLAEMTADEEGDGDGRGRRGRGGRPVSAPGPPTRLRRHPPALRPRQRPRPGSRQARPGGRRRRRALDPDDRPPFLGEDHAGPVPARHPARRQPPEERDAIAETYRRAKLEPPTGRPFRAPHFSTRPLALVGRRKPGEVDLARGGVLFLDDLPAFGRRSLRVLRQAIEEGSGTGCRGRCRRRPPPVPPRRGHAVLSRAGTSATPTRTCTCTRRALDRHWAPVEESILDLVHQVVEVPALCLCEYLGGPGETSAMVRERVQAARDRQLSRPGQATLNAHLPPWALPKLCEPDA